jgi:hypothetical protein
MNSQHHFELYLLTDDLTAEHWTKLQQAIRPHLGPLGSFELTFRCNNNVVRFFINSSKNLGVLSNSIDGFVLRPTTESDEDLPNSASPERFVNFTPGANLLDMHERYSVKKTKSLECVKLKVRSIGPIQAKFYFKGPGSHWTVSKKLITKFPAHLFAINFSQNTRYLKKTTPKYLDIEKSLRMLSSDHAGAIFSVDAFPYFAHSYYLGLSGYEFDKHSFIVGSSGSGKSKLIELIIDRLQQTASALNYRVVVIDPHASLEHDLKQLPSTKVVNFSGETAQLFPKSTTDVSAATELTTTLLLSLMASAPSARLERVLRFSLFVLFVGQCMSLPMLKNFLSELDTRNQLLNHVRGYVPDNILHFFGAEYNEIRTQHYNEAVSPIISLVDEMQLQPTLLGDADRSLNKTIQDNFLTVFSLNKVSMGEKVVKTVAGLLIQQIFLLAQARAFNQKVILIVDEVSVIQNPALASILAEARKFNLTVILSQQYFGQIDKSLRDAILSNVTNYYIFKVSEEDAQALEANLTIELPKEVLQDAAGRGLKELDVRIKLMTELHPRECLIRVASGGQIVPAVRGRTINTPRRVTEVLSGRHQGLRPYPQKDLPSRFVPGQTPTTPQLDEASLGSQPTGIAPSSANLSDLLARNSSSRRPIEKDE